MTDSEKIATIWYDTEFLEDGRTIMPISIGMVRERPGQPGEFDTLYAINREADLGRIEASPWLVQNVLPHLPVEADEDEMHWWNPEHPDSVHAVTRAAMADQVHRFMCTAEGTVQLRSWYGAYDHVMLAQLFGPMIARPGCMPMWTYDLRQRQEELGITDDQLPPPAEGTEHSAIADAWHHQQIDWFLREKALAQRSRAAIIHSGGL